MTLSVNARLEDLATIPVAMTTITAVMALDTMIDAEEMATTEMMTDPEAEVDHVDVTMMDRREDPSRTSLEETGDNLKEWGLYWAWESTRSMPCRTSGTCARFPALHHGAVGGAGTRHHLPKMERAKHVGARNEHPG